MAGHSHASNVMHRKSARDAKRSSSFTKIVQKITSAAKSSTDPEINTRLRVAIHLAQKASVPKATIEKAIEKASKKEEDLDTIRYNISIGAAGIIVEALTENKNRTASNVRAVTTKKGGTMVETGAIEFMFENIGRIVYEGSENSEEEMFTIASNLNCKDFESLDGYYIFYTYRKDLHGILDQIINLCGNPLSYDIIWKPKSYLTKEDASYAKAVELRNELLEVDDVQDVFINCNIGHDFG